MGRLILCYSKKAAKPYYIKNMNLNLYTIEELCYYLYDNIYFLDDSVINDELIEWIENELELTELSELLNKNRGNIKKLIMIILEYVGYVSDKDVEKTDKLLTELDGQSAFDKTIARAEHYLNSKKYAKAILEYKKLKEIKEDCQKEKVFNNMGVAYARMFLFVQAAHCFKKAYEISNNQEEYKQFQYALALASKEERKNLQQNMEEDLDEILKQALEETISDEIDLKQKQLNEVLNYKKENQIGKYYKGLEHLLNEWKKEYVNFTI